MAAAEASLKILMVTPHLPPYQAANALLPHLLGRTLAARGHRVRYLTFGSGPDSEDVVYVRRRTRRLRATRVPQVLEAAHTWLKVSPLLAACELVHVHSNTWINQVAARLAHRRARPYLLTHYGTEIWHHDGKDRRFRELNRRAFHVTFYSHALLARARELALPLPAASVVYPPVADAFAPLPAEARRQIRRRYAPGDGPLLLNVKRLHPLADHATLLEAFARVRRQHPAATLLIAGSGETEPSLRAQAARLELAQSVRFLALVPNEEIAQLQAAADVFVLSSLLEATPTVAVEALACGTPVISTDNPGGLELRSLFGDDVTVVSRRDPEALAAAASTFLAAPRRTRAATAQLIDARFRLDGVADRYLELYRAASGGAA